MQKTKQRRRLAVVGAGALGTETLFQMSRSLEVTKAFQHVHVIDHDRLQASNLALSPLFQEAVRHFGPSLLGRSKAEVVCEFLQIQSSLRWTASSRELADVSWQALRGIDLLVSCTDNVLARVEASFAARALNLPLLDAGVRGAELEGGRVTWFSPAPDAACFLCGLTEQRRAEILTFATAGSAGCVLPQSIEMGNAPVVRESLQLTATALVDAVLAFAAAQGDSKQSADVSYSSQGRPAGAKWLWKPIQLARSTSCPWHDGECLPLVPVGLDQTFGAALRSTRGRGLGRRLNFAWPLCLETRCRRCGGLEARVRRLATVRLSGICTHCQTAHQLEPLRTISSVGHNEAVAEMTPRQLGLADRQLLQLRPVLLPEIVS